MGIKSLVIIFHKGKHFITHSCHYDSCPSVQGTIILHFLGEPTNITKLKAAIDEPVIIKVADKPFIHEAMRDDDNGYIDFMKNYQAAMEAQGLVGIDLMEAFFNRPPYPPKWPGLYRCTGARILDLIACATSAEPVVVQDSYDVPSAADDWAYVIDLDAERLEVYGDRYPPGSTRLPLEGDRFASDEGYSSPALVARWAFDELPDEGVFRVGWEVELRESGDEEGHGERGSVYDDGEGGGDEAGGAGQMGADGGEDEAEQNKQLPSFPSWS